MPAALLSKMFDTITRRKTEWQIAIHDDLRTLVKKVGDAELTGTEDQLAEHSLDHAATILDVNRVTETTFRNLVDNYKDRKRKAKFASQRDALQSRSELAEQLWRAADAEEGGRHRQEVERIGRLEEEAHRARQDSEAALAAWSDLIATADTSEEERRIIADHKQLGEQLTELNAGPLNPNAPAVTANTSYMIGTNPAALARDLRAQLAEIKDPASKVNQSPARKADLERQLSAAEKAIATREREGQDLIRHRNELAARLEKFAIEKLRPENFPLPRASRNGHAN